MGRYLVVENDVVTNVVNFDPDMPSKMGWVSSPSDDVAIGWKRTANGGFRAPKPEKPPVPAKVEMLNLRRTLRSEGALTTFQTAVSTASEEDKEFWQYATSVARDDPSLERIATAAKFDSAAVDEFFRRAK